MKELWARRWEKALRSGKYKQGRGLLKDNQAQYCCLGVLTEIAGGRCTDDTGDSYALLPKDVREKVGMVSSQGGFRQEISVTGPDGELVANLLRANDHLKYTFDQIADIIKANRKKL